MPSLLVIGECMMELNTHGSDSFARAFAGDTYNSAVYAKRVQPQLDVGIFTAVGTDAISDMMVDAWTYEGIGSETVQRTDTANVGIYAISTDDTGERSFTYWRKDSAATQMMQRLAENGGADSIPAVDIVYFSGISLGVLNDDDKAALIDLVTQLKARGSTVAFDPNYRPKMWRDLEHAKEWMTKAYAACSLAFPGLEDHEALFDQTTAAEIKDFLRELKVDEIVVKCGGDGVYGYDGDDNESHLPFTPAPVQVDSTAAGDSFAGGYLASRLVEDSIADSIATAAKVAGFVVQHRGAILDKQLFKDFIEG